MVKYFDNAGELVLNVKHSFTKKADATLDARYGRYGRQHMRMGRHSVIVVKNDFLASETYDCHSIDDPQVHVTKTSQFYEMSKQDRLSQIARVRQAIKPTHPLFDAIMHDIEREEQYYA